MTALPNDRVLIVAELGNTHEGDPDAARAMVAAAASAGCDAIKLQVFDADRFVRPDQAERLAQMRGFMLGDAVMRELCALARSLGMLAIATPLDHGSLLGLRGHVDALKIASGDNDHHPLIAATAAEPVPLVISTGLADTETVRRAVGTVRDVAPDTDLWLLQCTAAYPAMPEEAHLAAIASMRGEFGVPVGYSDHTAGVEVAALAVAAGARMIEKHITLDHRASGFRDHLIAADPAELRRLVGMVRWTERVMGDPVKRPHPSEAPLMAAARRAVVAARDLPAGTALTADDITWMRPRDGLAPGDEARLLGVVTTRAHARGAALTDPV